jgi:hypothetical protein
VSISLPPDITALMTTVVTWEAISSGPDGHGEWTYGPAIELQCWTEPHGVGVNSGQTAARTLDGTVVDPDMDFYFSGDNANARKIKLWDRFTPGGIASEAKTLQALIVETLYGPPFDNRRPWLIVVSV